MQILLIDAYDSFVHIIYQYLLSLGVKVDVVRNDKVSLSAIDSGRYDALLLGPGPGHPKDAGYIELIERYGEQLPLFGVCLGMQAITLAFGGKIACAKHLMHGKTSQVKHDGEGCFQGMPNPFEATRYHSLITSEADFPEAQLIATATALDDGYIMGLRHRQLPIEGVQFHPESICTQEGIKIFGNVLGSLAL